MKGQVTITDKGAMKRVQAIVGDHVQEFGQTVVEMARDLVPVDTGNLKRSIEARKTGDLSLTIQTRTGYGAPVELGTRRRAATPYLAPAFQQAVSEFEKSGPWDK